MNSDLSKDELDLEIQDLSRGGAGIGKIGKDQHVVFVPLTAPGDLVRVRITNKHKKYFQAELIEILRASPFRIKPKCPVFGLCGGCSWQHLDYSAQWNTKVLGVRHALERQNIKIADTPIDLFPAQNPWNYRNRIQLRGHGNTLGFRKRKSHTLVPIERCEIAREELNKLIPKIKTTQTNKGLEYKVELEVLEDGSTRHVFNKKHAALGFNQINDAQNEQLRSWIVRQVPNQGTVWDLYGGSGNFSSAIEKHHPNIDKIHCVDLITVSRPSSKIIFHSEAVRRWVKKQKLNTTFKPPLSIIIDPPRNGLKTVGNSNEDSFSAILSAAQQHFLTKIILIGCETDPWARDLGRFLKHFRMTRLAIVDLFPQTPHIETLVVLEPIDSTS